MITELPTKIATTIYELPLSEAMRLCLLLENLFLQFDQSCHATTPLQTRQAMETLVKIIDATDRPDIKSKLSQILTQFMNSLNYLKNVKKVNSVRLEETMSQLDTLQQLFHSNQKRLSDTLRDNEFLQQIRSQAATPGGVADHRLPSYVLWQQQTSAQKQADLTKWISGFDTLQKIVTTIVTLTRDSSHFESAVAHNGFYHHTFNPTQPYLLARIIVPTHTHLFPEFSAGKHRLTIRFLKSNYDRKGKAEQTNQNVAFELSCCKL